MQLQRALHDPSWGIRVLSSETISHFLQKIIFIHFLTTNAQPALALRCACTSFPFPNSLYKKKVKQWYQLLKLGGENEIEFLNEVQRRRTNRVWPFQQDYIMCKDAHAHLRARASRAFVVKKCINMSFFRKWQIVLLDKTLIARLGLCRDLWSYNETAFWPLKSLATIEVLEKSWNVSSKSLISLWLKKERHEHLGWHGGEEIYILEVDLSFKFQPMGAADVSVGGVHCKTNMLYLLRFCVLFSAKISKHS